MTTREEGLKLLRAELERIKADPSHWDQDQWISDCGTSFCLGGGAAVHAGFVKVIDHLSDGLILVPVENETCTWLGFSTYGNFFGLTILEAEELFDSQNTLEDLERILFALEQA